MVHLTPTHLLKEPVMPSMPPWTLSPTPTGKRLEPHLSAHLLERVLEDRPRDLTRNSWRHALHGLLATALSGALVALLATNGVLAESSLALALSPVPILAVVVGWLSLRRTTKSLVASDDLVVLLDQALRTGQFSDQAGELLANPRFLGLATPWLDALEPRTREVLEAMAPTASTTTVAELIEASAEL
jgi:hypothetical protein